VRASGFKNSEHIIGVKIKDKNSDMRMAIESVKANSRNSRPIMPLIRRIGMNTAMRER
jgi:hypothetical protein